MIVSTFMTIVAMPATIVVIVLIDTTTIVIVISADWKLAYP